MQNDRHAWKAPKRNKEYKVPQATHPLHGELKKIVVVKVPAAGGYYLQRMKLKTALQKGYYKVNATNPKDKEAIEKALESVKNNPLTS